MVLSTGSTPSSSLYRVTFPMRTITGFRRSLMQCAAVTTQFSAIKLPPQSKSWLFSLLSYPKATWIGLKMFYNSMTFSIQANSNRYQLYIPCVGIPIIQLVFHWLYSMGNKQLRTENIFHRPPQFLIHWFYFDSAHRELLMELADTYRMVTHSWSYCLKDFQVTLVNIEFDGNHFTYSNM